MSDKIWVVKTPGGVFVEYEEPRMDMSVCTVEAYIKEERLIRAEARIKVLEEALGFYANTDNWFNKWPHNRWNRIEKSDEEQSKTAPITIGGKRARAALRGES